MKELPIEKIACCCSSNIKKNILKPRSKTEIAKSTFLAVFIAFFPKCPLCWAAYMSLFGSIGISRIPYMPWLLPVLIGFLALHFYFLFQKIKDKGYLPLSLSIIGGSSIVISRYFLLENTTLNYFGLTAIILGSLLNNLSIQNFKIPFFINKTC